MNKPKKLNKFSLWYCKRQCAKYNRLMLRELRKEADMRDTALIREYIELRNLYGKEAERLSACRKNVNVFRLQRAAFAALFFVFAAVTAVAAVCGIAELGGVRVYTAIAENDIRYLNPSFNSRFNIYSHSDYTQQARDDGFCFPEYLWTKDALSLEKVVRKKDKDTVSYKGIYKGEYGICEIAVEKGETMPVLPEDASEIEHDGMTGYWFTSGDFIVLYKIQDSILYEFTFSKSITELSALPLQTFMELDIIRSELNKVNSVQGFLGKATAE